MKSKQMGSSNRYRSRAGAALLVAIVLGAAIALALGTFLYMATSELRMANSTGQMTMTNNVAEAGMEEVLAALNTTTANSMAYPTIDPLTDSLNPLNSGGIWTNSDYDGNSTADRRKIFTTIASTSQKITTSVSVLLLSTTTAKHYYAVSKAVSTGPNQRPIEKYSWAAIRRKPLAPPGMYARYGIGYSGNFVAVDSYRSSLGIYGATLSPAPSGSWSGKNIFSHAIVASASSTNDIIDVQNADIYGNVATGGSDPLSTVKNNGIIGDWGDTAGTKDASQTATNFTAEFELYTPDNLNPGLPKYVSDINTNPVLGPTYQLGSSDITNTTPWVYHLKASEIDGTKLYTVVGPVRIVIVPESSGSDGKIAFSGSGGIQVNFISQLFTINATTGIPKLNNESVPSLQIWTRGDIAMSGKGIVNSPVSGTATSTNQNIPLAVQIYGYAADNGSTTTASQTFDFTGNQGIAAMIYAPNANVKLGGGGSDDIDMMGSLVAKNITLNGKVKFHVDEDLANAENGKFGVSVWRELLTPAQRDGSEMSLSYSFNL